MDEVKEAKTVKAKPRTVVLNGNLCLKRKTALALAEKAKRRLSVELKDLQWDLEKAKYDLDCAVFDLQEDRGLGVVQVDALSPEEVRRQATLRRAIRDAEHKIAEAEHENKLVKDYEKFHSLVERYEAEICVKADVLLEHINWEKGTAIVPENEEGMQSVLDSMESDFASINSEIKLPMESENLSE